MTKDVKELPPRLVLVGLLSAGFTIAISLVYAILGAIYFVYRNKCESGQTESSSGAIYFWQTIFRVYFLSSECDEQRIIIGRLTNEYTIMILMAIVLGVSVISVVPSIMMIRLCIYQSEKCRKHINKVVTFYIICCISSIVVDLVLATYLGIDYSYLTSLLRQLSPGALSNYRTEVIRQGTFMLMAIAMKGYVAHLVNIVYLILIVTFLRNYTAIEEMHPIQKLGVLNAFESNRITNDDYNDITPASTPSRLEPNLYNSSFDRSQSWQHRAQDNSLYPYLDASKLARPSPKVVADNPWRFDRWSSQPSARSVPHMPAPDYSPTRPRRLKSALKVMSDASLTKKAKNKGNISTTKTKRQQE